MNTKCLKPVSALLYLHQETPLHIAAKQGNLNIVTYLVDKKANFAIGNHDKVRLLVGMRLQLLHTLSQRHSMKHKVDLLLQKLKSFSNLL